MNKYQVFKVGDPVIWESSGTTKRGNVIAIIPALCHPYDYKSKTFIQKEYKQFEAYNKTHISDGYSRKHESYLVLVNGKDLYWPRVNQLKIDKEVKGK